MRVPFTSLAFLAVVVAVPAATFTNSVSVDAFVRAAAPTLNYGGAGALSVSGPAATNAAGVANGAFDSLIRFNTAGMVGHFDTWFGANNWVISGAWLRVTEDGAPNNALFNRGVGAFEIRWIANDNWTEGTGNPQAPSATGISYNDLPSLLDGGSEVTLGTFTNAGVNATRSLPLALPEAFTRDLKAGDEVGLHLTAIDSAVGFTFDSRSFGMASARPGLLLSAVPRPGIASITASGVDVELTVTNGAAGEIYHTLSSAEAALPLKEWTPIATNVLDASGTFSVVIPKAMNEPVTRHRYFIVKAQ